MKHTAHIDDRGFIEIALIGPNSTQDTIALGKKVMNYAQQKQLEGQPGSILLDMSKGDDASDQHTNKVSSLIINDLNEINLHKFAYVCPQQTCSDQTQRIFSDTTTQDTLYKEFTTKAEAIEWLSQD